MRKAFRSHGLDTKVLWGGALSFIPILNIFSLGYLLECDSSSAIPSVGIARMDGHGDTDSFSNGARMFVLMLAYGGIPLLAWMVGQ